SRPLAFAPCTTIAPFAAFQRLSSPRPAESAPPPSPLSAAHCRTPSAADPLPSSLPQPPSPTQPHLHPPPPCGDLLRWEPVPLAPLGVPRRVVDVATIAGLSITRTIRILAPLLLMGILRIAPADVAAS